MIEYHISANGQDHHYTEFSMAAARAVTLAVSGQDTTIDVVVYSEEDARQFGGDDAVERYLEDPDASVFERIIVKAATIGRVA